MTAGTLAGLALKVTVGDTWRPLQLAASPGDTVAQVKVRALAAEAIAAEAAGDYEVKVGGVPVRDESQTLAAAGIRDGGSFVVLARRRRPVR
jgi:hypothetical protein